MTSGFNNPVHRPSPVHTRLGLAPIILLAGQPPKYKPPMPKNAQNRQILFLPIFPVIHNRFEFRPLIHAVLSKGIMYTLVNAGESKLQTSSGSKCVSIRVHHPLENTFIALCDNIQRIVAGKGYPPLEDLKRYYLRLLKGQEKLIRKLRRTHTYKKVLEIVFEESDWMSFDNIEMMVDFFKLDAVEKMIDDYKSKLSSVLTQRLTQIKEKMADLPPEHPMGRADLEKMVIEYNLDADGITLEDLLRHRQFLISRLKIPNHLLSFLKVLIGSVILVFGVPEELVPGVVKMIEEVWRELWRERIVSIEVKGRKYDLLKVRMLCTEAICVVNPDTHNYGLIVVDD